MVHFSDMFMRMKPNFLVLLLAAGLLTMSARGEAGAGTNAASAKSGDKIAALFDNVVAKGKGVEVKRSQLDDALVNVKASASAQGQAISAEEMSKIEQQVLDRLITVQLLTGAATAADKARGTSLCATNLEEFKARLGSEEALVRQLKSVGMSLEDLRKKITEEMTARAVLEREMKAQATDDQAKKFYDENPAKFEEPEMVRASHVLIATSDLKAGTEMTAEQKTAKRKVAEDVLKRARAGEDFAKLAKEFSDDPGSKDKGGEYTFPKGQMVPEFETAAFSLKPNEVSDIVTTKFGYHIIKLSEKLPAKKVEFSKVSGRIKEYLTQQELGKQQTQVKDYLAKLKKDAKVEILDEKLKLPEGGADAPAAGAAPAPAKPASK